MFFLFAIACKDPFDIVTPKTITPIHGTNYLHLKQISVEEDSITKNYEVKDIFVEIDTTLKPERVWLRIKLVKNGKNNQYDSKFYIDTIFAIVDSLPIDGNLFQIITELSSSPMIKFHLSRGMGITSDTTIYSLTSFNITNLLLTFIKEKKEVTAEMLSNIKDYKIWMEDRDTFIIDEKKFEKGDSVWYEYDTIKTNKKIEVRRPESIKIRTFLKFKYD